MGRWKAAGDAPHQGWKIPQAPKERDAGKENSLAAFQTLPSSRRKAGIFVGFLSSTTSSLMECLVSIVLLMPPKGFIRSCIFLQEGSEHRDPPQHFPAGCSGFNTMRRNSLQTHFSSSFPKEKYPLTLSRTPQGSPEAESALERYFPFVAEVLPEKLGLGDAF